VKVALLTYRGNPRCGGQGVYVRHLSRALRTLGHEVEVFSGQPYPDLCPEVPLTRLQSLDLYRSEDPFRPARPLRDAIDATEFAIMCAAGFPEPLAFSLRAWRELSARRKEFDVVHDNQCLGYGLLAINRFLPVLATVHHPLAVDRRTELAGAPGRLRRLSLRRWYAFIGMQNRVARRLPRLLTVSNPSKAEISAEMGIPGERIAVVPNGVDTTLFRPMPGLRRVPGRVVTTASADVPLKGLVPLLEALSCVRAQRPAELVVVGRPRPNGEVSRTVDRLGLGGSVRFVSDIADAELVQLYAEAELAVVPSLYEGFSFPAVEAMSCGVPVVATTGGALPEVVGTDGGSGLLVPPGDAPAMAAAIGRVLDDGPLRRELGARGRERVIQRYSWRKTAEATAREYEALLAAC
jgi:glycosyltransferase involved in cell wall biosynthesis